MSSSVEEAIRVLREALFNDSAADQQLAAAHQLGDLVSAVSASQPKLLDILALRQLPDPSNVTGTITASMLQLLHDDRQVFRAVPWLLRLIRPQWGIGGELRGDAPPVEDVAPHVLAAIDGDAIDANGFAAVLLGRYGPEAESVLPQLVERLRLHRTDCSRAPGLTWSVYMIGGLRPEIRDMMIEVATKPDSCPHSKKLAVRILTMNQVVF